MSGSSITIAIAFCAIVVIGSLLVGMVAGIWAQIAFIVPCVLAGAAVGKWLAYRDWDRW